jgi:hypothetical protein
VTDRLHAGFHHAFLQLGGHIGESLQRRLELGVLKAPHDFEQLISREHQLGNHGHQLFQSFHIHADRLARDRPLALVLAVDLARTGPIGLLRWRRTMGGCPPDAQAPGKG